MIGEFPVQRFSISANLLKTLSEKKMTDFWLNPDNDSNVKACIYKGSFVECIEFIYGFIPEVFEEYCKQFGITVYSKDGRRVGHLDVMESLYNARVLTLDMYALLKKIFLTRGQIIHSTFWTKDEYYSRLSWIVLQLKHSDLQELYSFIIKLCNKVNSSYRRGISRTLDVRLRGHDIRDSRNWNAR